MKLLITIGTCLVRTQRTCVEMFPLECLQGLLALEKCQVMMVSKMMELDTCGLCLADSQLMTRAETISASRGTARECRLPGCKILEETCEVSKTSWQSETQHVHQQFCTTLWVNGRFVRKCSSDSTLGQSEADFFRPKFEQKQQQGFTDVRQASVLGLALWLSSKTVWFTNLFFL